MSLFEKLASVVFNKKIVVKAFTTTFLQLFRIKANVFCFFCMSFFLTTASFSQSNVIQGYVLDKQTHEPLPYAHVVIKNTGYGTVTNKEGYFRYIIPEHKDFPVEVSVSFVGYNSRHLTIADSKSNIFFLQQEKAVLPEIIVEADFVHEMLEKAFKSIPDNYPDDGSRYKGFYRQTLYKEDSVVYMGEAFTDTYKSSYERSGMDSQIEILKFRKFTGTPNYEDSIKFYAGVFNTYLADYVKQKTYFLNPRFFDLFEYSFEKKVSFRDEMHFNINFEHIEADAKGRLLINENDHAYANIYFESVDSVLTGSFFRAFSTANVNYTKLDDVYYLNNYNINIYFVNLITEEIFVFNAIYAVSEATLDDASPIPYGKTAKYRDIFMDSPIDTSRTFWDNYNIIEDDTNIKSFTSRYEPSPHELQKNRSRNFLKLFNNFSFKIGPGFTSTSDYLYPNILVAYENTDTEAERANYVYDSKYDLFWSISLSYNLTRLSSINYYLKIDNFMDTHYMGHELSYLFRTRIKHHGNPMFLDAGFGYSTFNHKKQPAFEKRSEDFPFVLRNDDIYYTGIEGRGYHLEAQLAYFPERFLAVTLNAKLCYITDYKAFYKHNEGRMESYDITYQAYNTRETIFFQDKIKPSISIGIRFYPFGAF